jgi:hypothetical protein
MYAVEIAQLNISRINHEHIISDISGSQGGEYEDVFWDIALRSLVETYRRFRGRSTHHHLSLIHTASC